MIQPTASFKDNLQLLPSIEAVTRIDLVDAASAVVDSIENLAGKQGSLRVYSYLLEKFGVLNAEAARHGLEVFAEHTSDAKARPGAHPNIDRLFAIVEGAAPLAIKKVAA